MFIYSDLQDLIRLGKAEKKRKCQSANFKKQGGRYSNE